MSDLISRQNEIKAIRSTVAQYVPFLKGVNETLPMECEIALRSVPSAEPKTGEWTNAGVLTVRCSNCKSEFHELEAMNYCPNCGTRMRGEEE